MFFIGWVRGCGSGAKEREWVAAVGRRSGSGLRQWGEGAGVGCGNGAKEREWVAAFDLVSLNSFEQLSETTEKLC